MSEKIKLLEPIKVRLLITQQALADLAVIAQTTIMQQEEQIRFLKEELEKVKRTKK